ncbi:hypothetical protein LSAT2_026969, partial [Lamellibrachia satsuma]
GKRRGYQSHLQAKPRHRRTLNIGDNIYIMDTKEQIVTDSHEISKTWRRFFYQLLNVENQQEPIEPTLAVDDPVPEITTEEIQKQLWKMKNNKSCGPDEIPTETLSISRHLMPNHEQSLSGGNTIGMENQLHNTHLQTERKHHGI